MSHLRELGEFGLIARLRERLAVRGSAVALGIGDDCAVLEAAGSQRLLITTDMLIENVHFRRGFGTPRQLGWKALAVNVSDVAAMGGTPTAAVVGLGLSDTLTVEFVDELYAGMEECAERFGVSIAGGDTVKSPSGLVLIVTLLGEVESDRLTLRGGARPGDALLVTGQMGDSAAGLELMFHPEVAVSCEVREKLVTAHCQPVPRVSEMCAATGTGAVHAAIDLSDGLGGDLRHIAEESRVGAEVYEEVLPISSACRAAAAALGRSPLDFALSGGEDYEILMAVAAEKQSEVKRAIQEATHTPVTCIGRVTERRGELLLRHAQGHASPLGKGYEHFADG